MGTRVAAATVLPVLSLFLLLRGATCSDDYSAFVYAGCSQGHYAANSEYASGVDSVLISVANSAPYAPYANFTAPSDASIAGLYQCRSDLPASVCTGCSAPPSPGSPPSTPGPPAAPSSCAPALSGQGFPFRN
ncbi:unnamed protein product [Urochloa humidicola]